VDLASRSPCDSCLEHVPRFLSEVWSWYHLHHCHFPSVLIVLTYFLLRLVLVSSSLTAWRAEFVSSWSKSMISKVGELPVFLCTAIYVCLHSNITVESSNFPCNSVTMQFIGANQTQPVPLSLNVSSSVRICFRLLDTLELSGEHTASGTPTSLLCKRQNEN
jgi:hypothetical protein